MSSKSSRFFYGGNFGGEMMRGIESTTVSIDDFF